VISAAEILARSTLLVEDHFASDEPGPDIAQAFADTTIGVVLNAGLLRHPSCVVALETLRVLLAGMCVGMRLDIRGHDQPVRLGPPFDSSNWLDALMNYRHGACAPFSVGHADSSCLVRIGLGLASEDLDFEMAASEAGCWLRRGGAPGAWEAATIWSGAGVAIQAAAEIEKRIVDQLGENVRHDQDLAPVRNFVVQAGAATQAPPGRKIAVVSAGAITNAAIFLLARCGMTVQLEVWDDDVIRLDNLNRYPLFDIAHLGMSKVDALAALDLGRVSVKPIMRLFDSESTIESDILVVGADRVGPRWEVARRSPRVAIVGSTDHYLTLTSLHSRGTGGCPACLHPRDDGMDAVVPTISFVSFAAGLEVAALLLQTGTLGSWYQLTRTWLRPDVELCRRAGPIPLNPLCPVHCTA
jgi:hypothetical protein